MTHVLDLGLDMGSSLISVWAQERRWHGPAAAVMVHVAVAVLWLSWPAAPPSPVIDPVIELVLAPPPAPEPPPPAAPVRQVAPAPAPAVKPAMAKAAPAVKAAPVAAAAVAPVAVEAPAPPAASPPAASPPAASPIAPPPAVAAAVPSEPALTPSPTDAPRPLYPRAARQRGWQGVVMVLVQVAEDGVPLEVAVKASSGHAMLDEAALDAVKRWRFSPARQNGRPVTAAVEVPVRFSLEG